MASTVKLLTDNLIWVFAFLKETLLSNYMYSFLLVLLCLKMLLIQYFITLFCHSLIRAESRKRVGTALKYSNAIDSFPQFFCLFSFIKFTSFDNWRITFIYWREWKYTNQIHWVHVFDGKNIMTFSCESLYYESKD